MAKANIWNAPTADGKIIKAMSAAYGKASKALHHQLAIYAASCIMHAVQHGQITPTLNMLNDMGDALRKETMVKWLVTFGPFNVVDKTGEDETGKKAKGKTLGYDAKKATLLKAKLKKNAVTFGSELVKLPFYKWEKPADPFKGFDLEAQIKALLKRAESVEKDETKAKHKDTDLSMLPALRSFIRNGGKLTAETLH